MQDREWLERAPLPVNPPHIVAPTRVRRCGRGFIGPNGKPVAMGEIVVLPRNLALDLVHFGKAELVED